MRHTPRLIALLAWVVLAGCTGYRTTQDSSVSRVTDSGIRRTSLLGRLVVGGLPEDCSLAPWSGSDKFPFASSNPQLSKMDEFVHTFAEAVFGDKRLALEVEEALFVVYWHPEEGGRVAEVAAYGFAFSSPERAQMAAGSLRENNTTTRSSQERSLHVQGCTLVIVIRGVALSAQGWQKAKDWVRGTIHDQGT